VWRTLPLLAWNPGALTRRYIHGERARFVSPLALFLFAVFLMFAVFGSLGGPFGAMDTRIMDPAELTRAQTVQEREIAALDARRAAATRAGQATAAIDRQLADARSELDGITAARALATGTSAAVIFERLNIATGSPARDAHIREALKNPRLLLYKLQNAAYKFSWALIPLSLPFMWLIFAWRRQYRMYDHAVFVTYSLSAVIVLLVAMALLAAIGVGTEWMALLVPVHFFLQLKGAYELSTGSALWRTVALIAFSTLTLSLFALGLLMLGLLG
jgi:hypothetical protein